MPRSRRRGPLPNGRDAPGDGSVAARGWAAAHDAPVSTLLASLVTVATLSAAGGAPSVALAGRRWVAVPLAPLAGAVLPRWRLAACSSWEARCSGGSSCSRSSQPRWLPRGDGGSVGPSRWARRGHRQGGGPPRGERSRSWSRGRGRSCPSARPPLASTRGRRGCSTPCGSVTATPPRSRRCATLRSRSPTRRTLRSSVGRLPSPGR